MRNADTPRPRVPHKSPDEEKPVDLEGRTVAAFHLAGEKLPGHLRGERFADHPSVRNTKFQKGGLQGHRVIVERPLWLPRVGAFDQPHPPGQRGPERPQQGPVAVQSGKMEEDGKGDVAMRAKLKAITPGRRSCRGRGDACDAWVRVAHRGRAG